MDMTGEERIAASRETVWAALNDVEVLKQCIPGCESLEKQSDTEMTAKVKLQIGPVSATLLGQGHAVGDRPAQRLPHRRRGQRRRGGPCQGQRPGAARRGRRRHHPEIRGEGRRWRQARPARRAPHRRHRARSSPASSSASSGRRWGRHRRARRGSGGCRRGEAGRSAALVLEEEGRVLRRLLLNRAYGSTGLLPASVPTPPGIVPRARARILRPSFAALCAMR